MKGSIITEVFKRGISNGLIDNLTVSPPKSIGFMASLEKSNILKHTKEQSLANDELKMLPNGGILDPLTSQPIQRN